ncbi:hypothetical protein F4819DRAFT_143484 [Hypoxylon fuscum]|nr:hypothetical protein F4819DRAFT_143484 [Hypoxylon fuscum]
MIPKVPRHLSLKAPASNLRSLSYKHVNWPDNPCIDFLEVLAQRMFIFIGVILLVMKDTMVKTATIALASGRLNPYFATLSALCSVSTIVGFVDAGIRALRK